jgi:hypothetical protein
MSKYFAASFLALWSASNLKMDFRKVIISSLVSCHIVAHVIILRLPKPLPDDLDVLAAPPAVVKRLVDASVI